MEVERDENSVEQPALPGFRTVSSALNAGHRYAQVGNRVLYCGEAYADCVSADAANRCVHALNYLDVQQDWATIIAQVR